MEVRRHGRRPSGAMANGSLWFCPFALETPRMIDWGRAIGIFGLALVTLVQTLPVHTPRKKHSAAALGLSWVVYPPSHPVSFCFPLTTPIGHMHVLAYTCM